MTRGDNGITPLRLCLALLVVWSHTYAMGGWGLDPLGVLTNGQMQLGTVGVIGFFGLSGYLLAQSRLRSSLSRYLSRRARRILPGLFVCLGFMAVIVIPLAIRLGGQASPDEIGRFLLSNATFQPFPVEFANLYPGSGTPKIVDGPLWTLSWEVYLYALIAAAGVGGALTMRRSLPLVFAFSIVLCALLQGTVLEAYGRLPVAFLTGSLIHLYRVPLTRAGAVAALLVTVVATSLGGLGWIGPLTLPYVFLWLGFTWPLRWEFDISYGVYIYGAPIQSLLAMVGVPALGVWTYLAVSLLPILGIAALSARFVEAPFMRKRPSPKEGPLVTSEIGLRAGS